MHAQHVDISVQLLASVFHFIIASVSDLIVSAVQIPMANEGLFERRVVSVYNVYLHILCMIEPGKGIRFSSSVKHLQKKHLSAPSAQVYLGWSIDGRSKKGRFKHTLYFGTLHAYADLRYA